MNVWFARVHVVSATEREAPRTCGVVCTVLPHNPNGGSNSSFVQ